jgi:hypothetical protein
VPFAALNSTSQTMTAVDDDTRALLIPGQCDIREYGAVTDIPAGSGHNSASDSDSDVQDGVRRIEALARTWSKWGLLVAYMRLVGLMMESTRQDTPLTW